MGGSSLQDCNPKGGVHCSPPDVAKETMDAVRRENPNLLDQKERFTWVAKGSVLVVLIKAGPRCARCIHDGRTHVFGSIILQHKTNMPSQTIDSHLYGVFGAGQP